MAIWMLNIKLTYGFSNNKCSLLIFCSKLQKNYAYNITILSTRITPRWRHAHLATLAVSSFGYIGYASARLWNTTVFIRNAFKLGVIPKLKSSSAIEISTRDLEYRLTRRSRKKWQRLKLEKSIDTIRYVSIHDRIG